MLMRVILRFRKLLKPTSHLNTQDAWFTASFHEGGAFKENRKEAEEMNL